MLSLLRRKEIAGPRQICWIPRAVLKKRGERIPKKPPVAVNNLAKLLLTASRAFPLGTIHREKVDGAACWIGRVVDVAKGRVTLLEIGPDALYLIGARKYERAVRLIWGPSNPRKAG
jgi:hypothetical protein